MTGANLTQPIALVNLSEQAQASIASNRQQAIAMSLLETLESVNKILDKHENVSHIITTKSPWTIDNGLITLTIKVKRTELESLYSDEYETRQSLKHRIIFQE